MNDYASLLGEMNMHAEAEAMQREAIAVGRQVLGPGTLTVANLTNNLAGNPDIARPACRGRTCVS